MIRRNARERREFLFRKSLEGKEKAIYERKRKIKECLAEGKKIPTELRDEEASLRHDLRFDDEKTDSAMQNIDDEYQFAGVNDPKVMVTTSRDPSSRLKQFAQELCLTLPNAQRLNRGNTIVKDMVEFCKTHGCTDIVIVHEHRGIPDGLLVCHLPYGPTASFGLMNVVMRHDIAGVKTMSQQYPHLVFDGFSTPLGNRVTNILKHLFPVPRPDSTRVITCANSNDFISFRHHVYEKKGHRAEDVQLTEVGPRFEMKLFSIKLGTIDMPDAQDEWVLRPYFRTAYKRQAL